MLLEWLEVDIDSLEPILLTEELLVKLGFETAYSHEDQAHEDYHEWYEKRYPLLGYVYRGDGHYLIWEHFDDMKIYYLHQLQNLYFALTGEELTIKM